MPTGKHPVHDGLDVLEAEPASRRALGPVGLQLPETLGTVDRLHVLHRDPEERAAVPAAETPHQALEASRVCLLNREPNGPRRHLFLL
jgi:hypothetical protein